MVNSIFRRLFFIVVSLLLISASTAQSQNPQGDWRSIGTWTLRAQVYTIYYSPSRTFRRTGLVRSWFKIVEPEANNWSHSFALMEFNCRSGKYRFLQQGGYGRNGGGTSSSKPSEWQYPFPESVNEMQYTAMCHPSKIK